MKQHRSTPSSTWRLDLLPLPSSQTAGYQPLKSPSFYKPKRAYDPYAARQRRRLIRRFAWFALVLLAMLGIWAWRGAKENVHHHYREGEHDSGRDSGLFHAGNRLHRHHAHNHHHQHQPQPPPSHNDHPRPILSKEQKLAALTSFILSPLHGNSVPSYSSQGQQVQIEDLLEFNLDNPRALDMISEMVRETWNSESVVVFGKHFHPPTRALISMLKSWGYPDPAVVRLDQRDDGIVLENLLKDLVSVSGNWELPMLIWKGLPIVGLENVKMLKENGQLDMLWHSSSA